MTTEMLRTRRIRHHPIPPIYVCYSNQGGFLERYFVVQLYERLVKHGLGEGVLWFDHGQGIHADRSATWFADRLEAIDLSLGSLLILSNPCQCQRLMVVESKAILDRKILSKTASSSYGLFVVLLDQCQSFAHLCAEADFCHAFESIQSIANVDEQISAMFDDVLRKLLPYKACAFMRNTLTIKEEQFRPLCTWSPEDIQSYLTRIGIDRSSRDLFLRNRIDGYLLLSCTESELKEYFRIDDPQRRQELIDHVIQTIHNERESSLQWHCTARKVKGSPACVYLIHHPDDSAIAYQVSQFLKDKHFRVFTHHLRYGKSKQQFLALNGPSIARTRHVIFILTKKSSCSIFPLLELTVAEWFEKSILTVAVEDVWSNMRSTLRALLGTYPVVDFIHQSLPDGLGTLSTHLPSPHEPVGRSLKQKGTVESLESSRTHDKSSPAEGLPLSNGANSSFIYLSYSKTNEKWNVTHMIERLVSALERHHFQTGIEVRNNSTSRGPLSHRLPKLQLKSSPVNLTTSYLHAFNQSTTTTTSTDIRSHVGPGDIRQCSLMVICLTPKYFYNEHCLNELRLCEIYQKPVLICLLRRMNSNYSKPTLYTSMNLDEQLSLLTPNRLSLTTLQFLRKNLRASCVDLTTDALFTRNITVLLRRLETIVGRYGCNQVETSTDCSSSNTFNQTSEIF